MLKLPRCLALLLMLAMPACLPMGKSTFQATTTREGRLKASDAAAHSTARIRREGTIVSIQEAYRFDLGKLLNVDHGYRVEASDDEAELSKHEAIITTAVHGAFGLGLFKPYLGMVDTPWAHAIYERTQIGRPFLVKSFSAKRDDYYVVPVFYQGRWRVANHVGLTPDGSYYSNGFLIENLTPETPRSTTVLGLERARQVAIARLGPLTSEPMRVFADTVPPREDAVLGYVWYATTATDAIAIDTHGAIAPVTPDQKASIQAGQRLAQPLDFKGAKIK